MKDTMHRALLYQGQNKLGKGMSGGRGANLIVNDPELVPFAHQAQHSLDEVTAELGVKPGGAHNNAIVRQPVPHMMLSRQLTGAVNTQRASCRLRHVGSVRPTVKNKIGRDLN